MSSGINWSVNAGDTKVLQSDLYLKYSSTTYGNLNATAIKSDIKAALASNESAGVVNYLVSLLRVLSEVA